MSQNLVFRELNYYNSYQSLLTHSSFIIILKINKNELIFCNWKYKSDSLKFTEDQTKEKDLQFSLYTVMFNIIIFNCSRKMVMCVTGQISKKYSIIQIKFLQDYKKKFMCISMVSVSYTHLAMENWSSSVNRNVIVYFLINVLKQTFLV